jgi:hypothetical protein
MFRLANRLVKWIAEARIVTIAFPASVEFASQLTRLFKEVHAVTAPLFIRRCVATQLDSVVK